jgi:hypothetical protein
MVSRKAHGAQNRNVLSAHEDAEHRATLQMTTA